MRFVYSDRYHFNIGVHVFPTDKYKLVKTSLLNQGLAKETDFFEPPEPVIDDIRLVHTKEYVEDLLNLRWTSRTVRSELPLTWDIVYGYMLHTSGTILAARFALEDGIAMHIGGGFHHAFADHAEGFCYINDIAVAIKKLQKEGKIERVAVIDCDLHQGNGTARIFQDDPRVFTFSIHQEHLYPIKERSSWDIGLDDETGDEEYNRHLLTAVPKIINEHKPQFVVYVAGADPFIDDQLGTLRLTKNGLAMRDRIVIENCRKAGIPVVPVLAGGYALNTQDTVDIHVNTARECLRALGQLPIETEKKSASADSGQ
jgi:acetoin utilization deacetylase AcuC-like enzyme|uniref:Histone deacetylase n=1 Tax=candidate division WOR-3 bacterium TaxID=2052148 RepID=A0A7V3PS75_UNCW3